MRDDALSLVLDLEPGLGVALVVGLWVPNSENWVVVLSMSFASAAQSPQLTSVVETALFLSTMFPSKNALASLFLINSATLAETTATSLSFSAF